MLADRARRAVTSWLILAGRAVPLLAVLLPGVPANPALAQSRDAPAAEVLFQKGRDAMDRRDYAEACARFRESHRLDPAPGTLFNLAVCEENLGHLADAWEQYRATLLQLPSSDPRIAAARERLAALEPRVPRVTVHLSPGAPSSSRIWRDQVELNATSLGLPLPVNPGLHTIAIEASGFARHTETVTLREGETRDLALAPGPVVAPAATVPVTPLPPPLPPRAPSPLGLSMIALGGGFLTVALGSGIWSLERDRFRQGHCQANRCDDPGLKAAGEMRASGLIALTSLTLGIASAGVGTYFLLASPSHTTTMVYPGPGTATLVHHF